MNWLRWILYRLRWYRWYLSAAYKMGDPTLGRGAVRAHNRRILRDRWKSREPKWDGPVK